MKVKDLLAHIEKLKLDPETEVILCMEWDGHPEAHKMPKGQWEDDLGGLVYSKRRNAIILLNENFK